MKTLEKLTPETLWSIGRLGMDAVSPDGNWVVYGVTRYDINENKGTRTLYSMNLQDRIIHTLATDANGAQFRPDGLRIGFLKEGKLNECNVDGSALKEVSDIEMDGFKYAPKGSHILYSKKIKYDQSTEDRHPDLKKASGRIYENLFIRHWTEWADGRYSNLFLANYLDGKILDEPKNIQNEPFDSPMPPFGGMEQVAFSPNGLFVAYTCKKLNPTLAAQSTNSDIYLYEIKSGVTINLTADLRGADSNPVFSADGTYMAWTSMERAGFEADRTRIMLFDTRTNDRKELTEGWDYEANQPTFSKDGKSMFFISSTDFTYQLYKMPLAGGAPQQLTEGLHNMGNFLEVAKGKIVAEHASMSEPTELYVVDSKTKAVSQLTFVTQEPWDTVHKGAVERRTVRTKDGHDMNVWLIYPPNFDPKRKYPALLYCQGGPQSSLSQWFSYRWNFQLMAANDYIIIAPCRRGMPGSGTVWNDAISNDWGGGACQDYLDATDALSKEPFIDKDRLGAIGASYGGYSVYWLAGNHQKRFKTFISHCGVFNFESFFGATEELWFANFDLNGPYWKAKDRDKWSKFSPHRYVQNWDTPILVIHDELDFRVPLGEGLQAYTAAQMQGIPSKFLYFPDEGHHIHKAQNSIQWNREFFGWLDEYLKNDE